jgi:hypothetical protein
MRNSRIGLAAMAALAFAGMSVAADAVAPTPRRAPKPKRRYPEQSARQALRGQRRAQGGPGLLRMTNGSYVPRNAVNA